MSAWQVASAGSVIPDLCPKCGAYWDCGCEYEVTAPAALSGPPCDHDWISTVGIDRIAEFEDALEIMMCRLCGLYKASFARPGDSDEQ